MASEVERTSSFAACYRKFLLCLLWSAHFIFVTLRVLHKIIQVIGFANNSQMRSSSLFILKPKQTLQHPMQNRITTSSVHMRAWLSAKQRQYCYWKLGTACTNRCSTRKTLNRIPLYTSRVWRWRWPHRGAGEGEGKVRQRTVYRRSTNGPQPFSGDSYASWRVNRLHT